MKILKILLILLVVVLAAGILSLYLFLNSTKPQYSGEQVLESLTAEVQIYYDQWGIPHIYAQNDIDLYQALGYVHAQDRLFQMEMLRRVGAGRLAEIFGPELADTDQFMRTLGINHMAEWSAQEFMQSEDEQARQGALAYLQGINKFLEQGSTPPEFTILGIPKNEFTVTDLFRISGYMGFTFNTAIRTDPLIT